MSRRSAGEGNISKRADGVWTARIQLGVKEDGKQKIKDFYGKSRKEVADKLADYRNKNYTLLERDTLKSKNSDRVIPLSQMAVTALNELRKTSKKYIISTRDGKPVRPRNFQNTFDYMLQYSGLWHKGLHAARHTFASLLFKKL